MIGYRLLLLICVHIILTYQENNANAIWQNIMDFTTWIFIN